MTQTRSKNTYSLHAYHFSNDTLVVCPQCKHQAIAKRFRKDLKKTRESIRITCADCGYNLVDDATKFELTLWLQADCKGNTLWAYNYEHLELIRTHVEAILRERNTSPNRNGSIGSRLPRWMTSGKNRGKVLKCIEKLRQKSTE